ncbi:hypothetical protein RKD19_000247 [Streptomyces canus]
MPDRQAQCWRHPAAWDGAGVWDQLHAHLLNKLRSKIQTEVTGGDRLFPCPGRTLWAAGVLVENIAGHDPRDLFTSR